MKLMPMILKMNLQEAELEIDTFVKYCLPEATFIFNEIKDKLEKIEVAAKNHSASSELSGCIDPSDLIADIAKMYFDVQYRLII